MKNSNTHKGAALLMFVFSVLFLIVMGRFIYIETTGVVKGVDIKEWAEDIRTSTYELDATRGQIYDKNGMVLAYDRPMYKLYAVVDPSYSVNLEEPKHVTDAQETASVLASLLEMNAKKIADRIEMAKEQDRFQVEFGSHGRNLSQDKVEKIKDLSLSGIQFQQQAKRYYPNGTFASHVLGFARTEDGKISGVTGIEKQMEKYLEEDDGQISYERDKYGTKLLDPNEMMTPPDDGEDVHLTIDQKIQTFLEDAMSQVEDQYNPEKILGAVIDPKTGEVLAMSNRPSFNPNNIGQVDNWYNDIISSPVEPGSTMKMFTWASAIEEGVYNGSSLYQSGSYQVTEGSRRIHDHNNGKGWGMISYDEGFQRSSNVAAAKLVWDELGPTKFREYLSKFHLDQKSGIDLPGEKAGKIVYRYPSEKITASYGQGTTMAPIQLMTAATSIANDGKMMKPYILSKITSSETGETITRNKPQVLDKPISKTTAKKMRDLLGTVVTSESGTAREFQLNNFSLAGKTGTAQIPDGKGRYMTGRENHLFSFMGMAPQKNPELLIYVAVQKPDLEVTEVGSEPVSYIVKTVLENSLNYLNIQPDENDDQDVTEISMPDVTDLDKEKAKSRLEETFEQINVIGGGQQVTATLPKAGTQVLATQRILLITDKPKMPDIKGWSLRDVLRLAEHFQLKVEPMGSGYVTDQNLSRGSHLKEGRYLVVELDTPD